MWPLRRHRNRQRAEDAGLTAEDLKSALSVRKRAYDQNFKKKLGELADFSGVM
jgi:hypothetical protein